MPNSQSPMPKSQILIMNETVIDCQNLETIYSKSLKRPILNGVNCQIQSGEFVVLLGLNGAGKSTLLRSLVGLVPVVKGNIHIDGVAMNSQTLPKIRRKIGMLFQGGGLIPQLSAVENVLCGRLGMRKPWETLFGFPQKDQRLALELLQQLGLQEHANQKTSLLSGGQQQRVAIARALIQSPQILLADEPITGLDVMAAKQVMETLLDLTKLGITVVTVLHDLGMAMEYAQRAIVIDCGCIVYDGSTNNLPAQFAQLNQAVYQ
jgi:phosphonate transport system ATP-binding protein